MDINLSLDVQFGSYFLSVCRLSLHTVDCPLVVYLVTFLLQLARIRSVLAALAIYLSQRIVNLSPKSTIWLLFVCCSYVVLNLKLELESLGSLFHALPHQEKRGR